MKALLTSTAFAVALLSSAVVQAQAVVGQQAPAFTAIDTSGRQVSLNDFKGKYVVLEWVNPSCPFVKKHYDSGNMPSVQKYAAGKGAVWLTVKVTDEDGADADEREDLASWMKSKNAAATATLVDVNGKVGRLYGAKTTPHMYMIDPLGKLIYAGAIDSKPTADKSDIATATNYLKQGLDEALAGKPLTQSATKPYGCSVKYG